MRNTQQNAASGGLGIAEALTIVFLVLKACGVIDWSWVWVLSPIWITLALVALMIVCALVVDVIRERKSLR